MPAASRRLADWPDPGKAEACRALGFPLPHGAPFDGVNADNAERHARRDGSSEWDPRCVTRPRPEAATRGAQIGGPWIVLCRGGDFVRSRVQAEQYAALHQPPDAPPAGPISIRQLMAEPRAPCGGSDGRPLHLSDGRQNAPMRNRFRAILLTIRVIHIVNRAG